MGDGVGMMRANFFKFFLKIKTSEKDKIILKSGPIWGLIPHEYPRIPSQMFF
jgi:hypothetical protein